MKPAKHKLPIDTSATIEVVFRFKFPNITKSFKSRAEQTAIPATKPDLWFLTFIVEDLLSASIFLLSN